MTINAEQATKAVEETLDHIALRAKAYAALVGSMITAVLATGIVIPDPYGVYAAIAAAVLTALGTYQVANKPGPVDPNNIDGHSTVETPVDPVETASVPQDTSSAATAATDGLSTQ